MLEISLAAVAGLIIGSFLNVCIFRLPRDLSVANPPRSFCPGCEHTIAWSDNIPLLSFALLRGRCRHCGERIPLRYPLVELATAVAFALCVAAYGVSAEALKYCVFSAIMIDLVVTDFEERILPDEFTIGGVVLGLIFAGFVPMDLSFSGFLLGQVLEPRWLSVVESAIGAGFASGVIWFVAWFYEKVRHKEGLGFGDVKMIATIGAFLGLQLVLPALVVGSLMGAVGGVIYIMVTRKDASSYELPYGSFLGIAALGIVFAGIFAELWE